MRTSFFAATALLSLTLAACDGAEAGSAEQEAVATFQSSVSGKAVVGQAAPTFSLPDLDAKPVNLADHKGKYVVLEWFNPGCPFVKHVWDEDVMPPTVKAALASEDTVWLGINSGSPGKQGTGVEANRSAAKKWDISHTILLDETGIVGKAYNAKTTPHMYIVDPEGTLVYNGAIDDAPMGRKSGEPVNYVNAAFTDLRGGEAVGTAQTVPYGCSVKYGS